MLHIRFRKSFTQSFFPAIVCLALAPSLLAGPPSSPKDGKPPSPSRQANTESPDALNWHDRYSDAYSLAKRRKQMLLINFVPQGTNSSQQQLDQAIARNPSWHRLLKRYVLANLSTDAEITVKGKEVRLLSHSAFSQMHGRGGLAIIDLASEGESYYGRVVSAFPFMTGKYYRWQASYLPTVLSLPKGTITQRTMVWAVRTHPERPASTSGEMDSTLSNAAASHSQHQANIGVQGHHNWDGRFHRIRRLLRGGGAPVEVVAESWPGQNMIDSCVDCVRSWRHSSGHWNAVRTAHGRYGYDIRRGRNGIWYGTGIFSR